MSLEEQDVIRNDVRNQELGELVRNWRRWRRPFLGLLLWAATMSAAFNLTQDWDLRFWIIVVGTSMSSAVSGDKARAPRFP